MTSVASHRGHESIRVALPGRRRPRRDRKRIVLHLIVVALMLIWATPTVGLLVSSFRPQDQLSTSGWWTAFAPPYHFTMDNYREVFSQSGIGQAFINSL